jgi:hypothetical protein
VLLRLEGRSQAPWSKGSLGTWRFDLHELLDLGVRGDSDRTEPPAGFVCSRQVYDWRGPYLQPLPRLAHRLTAALIDGWLAWSGSRQRLHDDPAWLAKLAAQVAPDQVPPLAKSGIDLDAKALVKVEYSYAGGRFVRGQRTGYLQQEGWSEAGCPLR